MQVPRRGRVLNAMIDLYYASYARPPAAVTLDIDDTPAIVHGHQPLSRLNGAAGGSAAAARQDAVRDRDPWPPSPLGPPHPPALARHAPDHSRRQPLRSPGGDGVV